MPHLCLCTLLLHVLTAGERLQEPCRERHRTALQELQLSPAQQQRMAAGWKFFQTLLAPLVAERKQLHAQGLQVSVTPGWVVGVAGCPGAISRDTHTHTHTHTW
jgi:hypothetical protein